MTVLKPENAEQVRDSVAWAVSEETPLEVIGGGSKQAIGRPGNAAHTLDLSALSGITLYEPEELVLSAGPGTPIAEIGAALTEKKQELAFEPPDYGPLLGQDAGAGTLGGVLAANLAGPRRIKAGAARDHFLGFSAVSGRAEIFKSGGRVVKNVTGYDLCKVLAGSWGTLGAMTHVTVKVLPAAEKLRTVLVFGSDAIRATAAMTDALLSPYEVSGAAFLPEAPAARSKIGYVREAAASVTAIRVEGPGPSVEYRCAALRRQLSGYGATEELHGHNSAGFWREVRDVLPFAAEGDNRSIWKISVPPQDGAKVTTRLSAEFDRSGESFLDWGGGLVWFAIDRADAGHAIVRAIVSEFGGHATLLRAPVELRATVPVFHPQSGGLARLSQRLKDSFDPRGVLNPGRLYASGG